MASKVVRHIVGGIVETIGIIATVNVIIKRASISGRTSAPGGGDKEVEILRHFCSPLSGMWYRREPVLEVLVQKLKKKRGSRQLHRLVVEHQPSRTHQVCETNITLVATGLAWAKDNTNT